MLIAIAVCLWIRLTHLGLLPLFRLYLLALALGMLTRGAYTPAWMGLAVLVIKVAATVEMVRLTCSEVGRSEMCSIWLYAIFAGGFVSCLVLEFRQQYTLVNPELVYIRQIGQVFLFTVALAVILFAWAYHNTQGFTAAHGWLMAILWGNYALIGILTPETGAEWRRLDMIWTAITISTLLSWLLSTARLEVRQEVGLRH